MAATQRRTLALAQPLHLKQEALTLRTLTHSPQNAAAPSDSMQSIDVLKNGFHSDVPPAAAFLGLKSAKLQTFLEESASPEARRCVDALLSQVQTLSAQEKMLLYLKLPGAKNTAPSADPLRQPINPLGTRHEIQQTITWIKTHLTEDPDVSLPKQDVYDEYMSYCETNSMKHLSTADFGKVMKQVFPRVRPRRLGTRGNSRYCYAGLCKRMRLDRPVLPDLACDSDSPSSDKDGESNLEAAASYLIREWAQKLLGEQFGSLRELAAHLVDKMCVDGRSVAAFALLSATSEAPAAEAQAAKDRDAQFERKLVEPKRKSSQDEPRPSSGCKRQRLKNGRSSAEEPKKRPSSESPAAKLPIPRLAAARSPKLVLVSPTKPLNKKYKRIQPKPEPPTDAPEDANFFTEAGGSAELEPLGIPNLEQSAIDDYLNGGNSQEQEDHELMTYFHHSSPAAVVNPEPVVQAAEEPAQISQLRRLLEGNERAKESTKRRVSFETLDTVPASPNTRRRVFNFLPISPDEAVPGVLAAPPPSPASTAASASPFVSPASTPVPRARQHFVYPTQRSRRRGRNLSGPALEMLAPPPDGRQRHVSAGQPPPQLLPEELTAILALPPFQRSQSVPLHQMAPTASVAPTPVPSEFADFDEAFDQMLMDNPTSYSYPSTPVLLPTAPLLPLASRSYPSTPVAPADPVISQLTLNAINQPARRNLAELIDAGGFDEHFADFTPAPEPFHEFDQSELTQLVQEVEGTSLLHDESLS